VRERSHSGRLVEERFEAKCLAIEIAVNCRKKLPGSSHSVRL
jgi:hypothetical protein